MRRSIGMVALVLCAVASTCGQENNRGSLIHAHAHNDYLHARPLADALAHGFRSVEADVWLTNGALLVAHDLDKTSVNRTLQNLYLEPLRAFVRTNSKGPERLFITLLVDVKSEAKSTYAKLSDVLKDYTDVLTRFENGIVYTNAVTVLISGNRAVNIMRGESTRYAALDGRLPDLAQNPPVALVPLISDNWTKHFQWRGVEEIQSTDRKKLNELVRRTHAQGRKLRLWAAPDHVAGWKELRAAGVDLLSTDHLVEMEAFLRNP